MSLERLQGSGELSQGFRADPPKDQTVYAKDLFGSFLTIGVHPQQLC